MLRKSRHALNFAVSGVFDGYVIRFERNAERLVQRHARIAEINQGGDLGRLRGHQIPLLLNHIKWRGRSSRQFLLFRIQQLLLQNPGLDSGAVTPSSLPHRHQVIGNIHCYLIEILAQLDLRLPKLQLVDGIIGLRLIVLQRRLEIGDSAVGGEVTPQNLAESSADSAVEVRVGGLDAELAHRSLRLTRQPAVLSDAIPTSKGRIPLRVPSAEISLLVMPRRSAARSLRLARAV